MAINWDDTAHWGGHVTYASNGSWTDAEQKEDD